MKEATNLHREAMDLAELAFMAKLQGNITQAQDYFRQAFEREKAAAAIFRDQYEQEPTRSILLRSAASLAIDCSEYREAERLVSMALVGNPPEEVAEELRNLLEQVHFERHLELHGITLAPDEFQMSIAGKAVGFGMALSDEFVDRVTSIEKLIYRTAERKMGRKYRDRGRYGKHMKDSLELFVSVPRAASFAVTFKLGQPTNQMTLPGLDYASEIIDEMLRCFDLFNSHNDDELKECISSDAYYRNFVNLAKQIAPDGDDVSVVGLTASNGPETNSIALTRTRKHVSVPETAESQEKIQEYVEVTGFLLYADATGREKGLIKLVDDERTAHDIQVPEGLMSDIVKPLWEDRVIVRGPKLRNNLILLEDIEKDTDLGG